MSRQISILRSKSCRSVGVERDADFAVAHQILERLRVHPRLGLNAAVGVAADVRGDVGHLDPVDIVVALNHKEKQSDDI